MRQPCKPDAVSIDVDLLNGVAPSTQPLEAFGSPDPFPSFADGQAVRAGQPDSKFLPTRTWEDQSKVCKASWESGSTMCSAEANDDNNDSPVTRKSFFSTGIPEEPGTLSPPNRLLHNLHDVNLNHFLEDVSV